MFCLFFWLVTVLRFIMECDGTQFAFVMNKEISHCLFNEMTCNNGRCVLLADKCDGLDHCGDMTDEINCKSCSTSAWMCHNSSQCIQSNKRCDAFYDCSDHSDELDCDVCPNNSVRCYSSRKCSHLSYLCNGIDDCKDGTAGDEVNCPPGVDGKCEPHSWQCDSGTCIPFFSRCNGYNNCFDDSDEINCTFCQPDHVQCINGRCIPSNGLCNGIAECADGSDEVNCTFCLYGKWKCNSGSCILRTFRCNGYADCIDKSDEDNCSNCQPDNSRCSSGRCLAENLKCDGINNCDDYSDEDNCSACSPGIDRCENGRCLVNTSRCDGYTDCLDNSDEINCLKDSLDDRSDVQTVAVSVTLCVVIGSSAAVAVFITFRHGRNHVDNEESIVSEESDHYDRIDFDAAHEPNQITSTTHFTNSDVIEDHHVWTGEEDIKGHNKTYIRNQWEHIKNTQVKKQGHVGVFSQKVNELLADDELNQSDNCVCMNNTDYITAIDVDYSSKENLLNNTDYITAIDVDYSSKENLLNNTDYITAIDVDYSSQENSINNSEYINAIDVDYNAPENVNTYSEYITAVDMDYSTQEHLVFSNLDCSRQHWPSQRQNSLALEQVEATLRKCCIDPLPGQTVDDFTQHLSAQQLDDRTREISETLKYITPTFVVWGKQIDEHNEPFKAANHGKIKTTICRLDTSDWK
ncbi:hypothetical protein Btru_034822 [Bulinus truncatus]|nr:hypothetical protein Btru_034822 [Bulinus truncatus]